MNHSLFELGKGNVAQVSRSRKFPDLCYKIIYDPEQYKLENLIKEEVRLMEKARKINTTSVKIPKPFYCIANKQNHLFVMETLKAVNLGDIISGKEKIPKNFNLENFFDELQNFLNEQHEKGIHHRDLHENNIMVEDGTSLPCVIDYGKAIEIKQSDEENPYLREVQKPGNGAKGTRTWMIDNEKIKQFYKEMSNICKQGESMVINETLKASAKVLAEKMRKEKLSEEKIPESSFFLIRKDSIKEEDIPLEQIDEFIIVQRGI